MSRLLFLALLPSSAFGFCGTYVGADGDDLYNDSSQIAVARMGDRTVLTLANDYQGTASDFAMVIPVPALLGEGDVRVVDPEVLARVDAYSLPRQVTYTCEQLGYRPGSDGADADADPMGSFDTGTRTSSGGCGGHRQNTLDSDAGIARDTDATGEPDATLPLAPEDIDTVEVEAEFVVGQYEIVVLSAEESGDLLQWLNLSGYAVRPSAEVLLDEYIASGSYFIAARVSLTGGAEDAAYLAPIQLEYTSEVVSLPIRLGALNARAAQELTLFVLNSAADGAAGISNYNEVALEDECMFNEEGRTFSESYRALVERTHASVDAGSWMTVYSWQPTHCDPCTEFGPLTTSDMRDLGYVDNPGEAHFTRIHATYTPNQASQDLVLYASQLPGSDQHRFIAYQRELETDFPVCGSGMVADPGSCYDAPPSPAPSGGSRSMGFFGLFLVGVIRRFSGPLRPARRHLPSDPR